MKEFILLKEGEYTTGGFADVMETFNNYKDRVSDNERLHYFTHTSASVLLHANVSTINPTHQIALSHFSVNPHEPPDDINLFKPIDMITMKHAADKHGMVVVTSVMESNVVVDNNLIGNSVMAVRDSDGHLINYHTNQRLIADGAVKTNSVTFFGLIRIEGLPLYYLITNPALLKIGDGFDFVDDNNLVFRQATEVDGKLTNVVFMPTVDGGNELVNDNIFVTSSSVEISFFDHPESLFASNNMVDELDDICFDIKSNHQFVITDNNKIVVDISAEIGYIRIKPRLGHFSDRAEVENIEFNFSIFKI